MRRLLTIVCIAVLTLATSGSAAQGLPFFQLNASTGLSDNYVQGLAIDSAGHLWIGTTDGLNVYDGYAVDHWFASSKTGLPSDTIRHIFCDTRNRIWVATPGEIVFTNKEKKFSPVRLPETNERFWTYAFFEIKNYGIVLFTSKGHYLFNEKENRLENIQWLTGLAGSKGLSSARSFDSDKGIYVYAEKVMIVDYGLKKIVFEKKIANAIAACYFDDNTIAVAGRHGDIHLTDIATQKDVKVYQVYDESQGKLSSPRITEMVKAPDGTLAIASQLAGLILIDKNGKITHCDHDPLNSESISSNSIFKIIAGQNGELIAGSQIAGVSICNINYRGAVNKRIFKSSTGEIFDGYIDEIASDRSGMIWIGAADRLIRWDKRTNSVAFFKYLINDPSLGPRNLEMRSICIDKKDRIWLGTIGAGVLLFDKEKGSFRLISKDISPGIAVRDNYINDIIEDAEGIIWAGSYAGVYSIDPVTYRITGYKQHPVLKTISEKVIYAIHQDATQRMWFGSPAGVFCFDKKENRLTSYTTLNGLLSNSSSAVVSDKKGNIFAAHLDGFSLIAPNGAIKTFSKANGLRYSRCESILPDNDSSVWITNSKCIIKYSPSENKLDYFDENAGISTDAFRHDAIGKSDDGTMYFGTLRGINYFDPKEIRNYVNQFRLNISQVLLPDSLIRFDGSPALQTSYTKNSVQFYFTAVNLMGVKGITYEYMLKGFDKDWQRGVDIHSARYSSLPYGNYTFAVRASMDKINWVESENNVSLHVVPPFWRRWWFVTISVILLLSAIIGILQFRINRVRYTERLKTIYNKKISETEMKALRAQMNPHFIFNSLNSINKYILKNDHVNASRYLTRFAKLIRLILDNSNSKEISLSDELEALKLYIEMESLRFTNKFSYGIVVDDAISPDTLQVPPLIIQPYVENAIWHGLLHKEEGGRLTITIRKTSDNSLQCIIEDNGIGRTRAKEMKSKSATANKSLGMKLTEERLIMLNQYSSLNASIQIDDLEDSRGDAAGTKVILTIPI